MQTRPRLLERFQERVRRFDAEKLRARNPNDPTRRLIRSARSEGNRLAHAIDADLNSFGLDREEIGMEAVQRPTAGVTAALGVVTRAEKAGGEGERRLLERRLRDPVEEERARKFVEA